VAHVDFHQHVDARLRCGLGHGLGQAGDALGAVHSQRQAPALGLQARGQACHTQQLGVGDHLVGQGDVAHAASGQHLGLGNLLHAGAHGTGALHLQGQLGAAVGVGVGPPLHRACGQSRPCG
jgi:hypothetical protein